MKRHVDSHLDHGLTRMQVDHLFERFADRRTFFIETFELPQGLGRVPCGLWGPKMGDPEIATGREIIPIAPGDYIMPTDPLHLQLQPDLDAAALAAGAFVPVFDGAISYAKRDKRAYESRLINAPMRPTQLITVIAGSHAEPCPHCYADRMVAQAAGNGHPGCARCDGGELKHPCILYTAFGGPLAPKEPNDPTLKPEEREASIAFWRVHALSRYGS